MARFFLLLLSISLLFPSGTSHADPLPASVDLRPGYDQLGLDCRSQGSRGTCSLFAVTAVANYEAAMQTPSGIERFSEEYLVWAADKATGRQGDQAMFYEAVTGLEQLGICPDEQFAYQPRGERAAPSADLIEHAARHAHRWRTHWIKRWDARHGLEPSQFDALRSALAAGHPVACGLRWPHKSGVDIMEVPPADQVFDGHSIALVGYQDDSEQPGGGWFWVRNSRGAKWGERGYGRMSYAYVKQYANDALWLEAMPDGAQRPVVSWEAEELEIVARQRCDTNVQRMTRYGSRMWGGRRQLACAAEEGGSVTLALDVPTAGTYRVAVKTTAAPDYGTIAFALDGQPVEGKHDLFSGRVSPAGRIELGECALMAGHHELTVTAVGKSPHSRGTSFGLDAVELLPPLGN